MKTRHILISFLGILTASWAWDALYMNTMSGDWPWVAQRHGLHLTGVWAISLMSLAMVLATRPAWLEEPLGGLDKIYKLHKWSGILGVLFGATHWLIKLAGDPLASLIGKTGRPTKDVAIFFAQSWRSPAKDMGEWAIYILLALLAITLWKRIPYRPWRMLHRAMPVLYLMVVFHTVALMPAAYWAGPTGVFTALLLLAGVVAAFMSLARRIGRNHCHAGSIVGLTQRGDVLEVVCEPDERWPGHEPGQFAFLTFDRAEGAHPFTIASAPHTDSRTITFEIKALGDYTRTLGETLRVGQPVVVEGPYGRLDYHLGREDAAQVWVAGGIGVTPFLAWLESLQVEPPKTPVQMHYCVRDAATDPFIDRVRTLCASTPNLTLYVHDGRFSQRLDAETLLASCSPIEGRMDVWFCGPSGFAKSLEAGLKAVAGPGVRMHREAFDMR